jgi:hypothetical protein
MATQASTAAAEAVRTDVGSGENDIIKRSIILLLSTIATGLFSNPLKSIWSKWQQRYHLYIRHNNSSDLSDKSADH